MQDKGKKSRYFVAQDLYKAKENPQQIKEMIYAYLNEEKKIGIDARLIFILARTELKLGNEEEAEKLFSICIKLDPKNIPARTELGRLYYCSIT